MFYFLFLFLGCTKSDFWVFSIEASFALVSLSCLVIFENTFCFFFLMFFSFSVFLFHLCFCVKKVSSFLFSC